MKEDRFMPDLTQDKDAQVKLCFSYLTHENVKDSYEMFKLQVLSNLLFEGPNSPFYKGIIEAGVAPAFSPGYGYDHTTRQGTLTFGVQGIKIEDIRKCENVISEIVKKVADKGIDERFFETILHQVEFYTKKTKDHFGLMTLSHLVPYVLHEGNYLDSFKINEYSA